MAVYWFLFAYFAVGSITAASFRTERPAQPSLLFTAGAIIMAAVIGLRYKVGGDWLTYQFMYERTGPLTFSDALSIGDPGYQLIEWISYQLNAQVWFVNVICAGIFVWGLFRFCRTQPAPWLAVLVAIPYMVIVIAMGYTRQAVALGILMAGIAAFLRNPSPLRFGIYVIAAALFHKTAVVALPIVALAVERNRLMNFIMIFALVILLYDFFLGNSMDNFVQNYVKTGYSSQGAAIRILMSMIAAAILWVTRKRLGLSDLERKLWMNFSFVAVICLVMLLITPSSTAVDRMSLYAVPLQVAVIGRIPIIFESKLFGTSFTALYCFFVEFVWLNFAQFAYKWVPYHFFPM